MTSPSFSQMQEILDKANLSGLPVLRVSILRNITVDPIKLYLRYFSFQEGFNAKVDFGEYDNIFQESVGGRDDLLSKETNFVMVFMNLATLSKDLDRNFTELGRDQRQSEIDRIKEHVKEVLRGVRRQTDAVILWHGFELPVHPALGILDSQVEDGQLGAVDGLNDFLKETIRSTTNAYFVDLDLCMRRLGSRSYYDSRYWHIGRAPYSREALQEMAAEDFKFMRSVLGRSKKCLVLDCDGTLWGGIIGEDGIAGIQLSKTYPGSEFYEFQQEILNLYHRGIIIAICSKNNEEDVWEVFLNHPDMVLQKEHIAVSAINWQDKVSSLRQIAQSLNIGLDSLVFVDDDEFEVNLVRQELPEVEVINLPRGRAYEFRYYLASCGLFDILINSAEDRNRGAMYEADANRNLLKSLATDLGSYYKSLDMVVDIRLSDQFSIARIAQLTQKTNQFNLTTKRYSDDDIRHLSDDPDVDVLYLRLADRFGDLGIVGSCILRHHDEKTTIDTFLLSCRVLGRGVEDVLLMNALQLAKRRGSKLVVGEYAKTKKNGQVEFFYDKHGFFEIEPGADRACRTFHFDLVHPYAPQPDYFKEIRLATTKEE